LWIMTTRGFYSIAAHPDREALLLVRARCREDIEALADLLPGTPIDHADPDYAWRLEATREDWQRALGVLVAEVDYAGIEDAVEDGERRDLYLAIWRLLLTLDDT
jgi:hypothetical protein